jgi:hemerythrin
MNAETAAFLPSTLIVNIHEMDEQHAALFSRLAALKMLCIERNELPINELEALLAALRIHCATEENLAGNAGLNFCDHGTKHEKMLAAISKALSDVREGRMDVFSVLRYIEYWFERHIREEDLDLGCNLQQVSSGMFDPEQAFALARNEVVNQSPPI